MEQITAIDKLQKRSNIEQILTNKMSIPFESLIKLNEFDFHTFTGTNTHEIRQAFETEALRIVECENLKSIGPIKTDQAVFYDTPKLESCILIPSTSDKQITSNQELQCLQSTNYPITINEYHKKAQSFTVEGLAVNLPSSVKINHIPYEVKSNYIGKHNILKGQLLENLYYLILSIIYPEQKIITQPAMQRTFIDEENKYNYHTRADFFANNTIFEVKFGRGEKKIKSCLRKYEKFVDKYNFELKLLTLTNEDNIEGAITVEELYEENKEKLDSILSKTEHGHIIPDIIAILKKLDSEHISDEEFTHYVKIKNHIFHLSQILNSQSGFSREVAAKKQTLYLNGFINQHEQLMWTMFKPKNAEILQSTNPFEYQSNIYVDGTWHQAFIPLATENTKNLSNLKFSLNTEEGNFEINAVLRTNNEIRNDSEYLSQQTYTLNTLEKTRYQKLLNYLRENSDLQIISKARLFDMFVNYPFAYACYKNQIDLISKNDQSLF